MQIYWIKAQAPLRVLALVKHLGLKVETIELNLMAGELKSAAYTQINPNGKTPSLVDGDIVLWESLAIMAYLSIKAESDMWPAHNPAEQVEILRWIGWNGQHWEPSVAPFYFEHIVKSTFGFSQVDKELLQGKVSELKRWAKVLDEHLSQNQFLACRRLTIVDFQLASMARYWRESEMPFEGYLNIIRWLDDLMKLPAWAEPWPEK